LQVIVAHCV